jgi:hypothetical protein
MTYSTIRTRRYALAYALTKQAIRLRKRSPRLAAKMENDARRMTAGNYGWTW